MSDNHFPISLYLNYLLSQADRQATSRLDAVLRREGITVEQWRILQILSDGNGWTMGELADAALLTLPTLTRVTDRMVGQAFIYRATDPGDRRKVVIYRSEKGREVGRRLHEIVREQQRQLFRAFGADRSAQLMSLLEEMIKVSDGLDPLAADVAGPHAADLTAAPMEVRPKQTRPDMAKAD